MRFAGSDPRRVTFLFDRTFFKLINCDLHQVTFFVNKQQGITISIGFATESFFESGVPSFSKCYSFCLMMVDLAREMARLIDNTFKNDQVVNKIKTIIAPYSPNSNGDNCGSVLQVLAHMRFEIQEQLFHQHATNGGDHLMTCELLSILPLLKIDASSLEYFCTLGDQLNNRFVPLILNRLDHSFQQEECLSALHYGTGDCLILEALKLTSHPHDCFVMAFSKKRSELVIEAIINSIEETTSFELALALYARADERILKAIIAKINAPIRTNLLGHPNINNY